jgi:hypothetical protein
MKNWFEVDKTGLAQILERKGKAFTLLELIQNSWDEPGVQKVAVEITTCGRSKARLVVEDDAPEGFKDLSHAFTLFAHSAKTNNPEQRGRFNLGEKLVMAICDEVTISTTRGSIRFDAEGRHRLRTCHPVGSRIECLLRVTPGECEDMIVQARRLIPPPQITTIINGEPVRGRQPLQSFNVTLPTEVAGNEGLLRRVPRETEIRLYEVSPGETATLYEMGIPVVETGDRWHYDIGQKVPLTLDRENVPPSYLRQVRVAAFNEMHAHLTAQDVNSEWAEVAIGSKECAPEAVRSYFDTRFGERRVTYDPSDPEANKLATSKGYTVVHGSMLSAEGWKNAKAANAILPAGQVTPGPKVWTGQDNPNAKVFGDWIPESKWTEGMRAIAAFAQRMAEKVLSRSIQVKFCATPHHLGAASYGPGELHFNKLRLGAGWFEQGITERVLSLLIHEFGHEYSGDHLSSEYHEALCQIGARTYSLALRGEI